MYKYDSSQKCGRINIIRKFCILFIFASAACDAMKFFDMDDTSGFKINTPKRKSHFDLIEPIERNQVFPQNEDFYTFSQEILPEKVLSKSTRQNPTFDLQRVTVAWPRGSVFIMDCFVSLATVNPKRTFSPIVLNVRFYFDPPATNFYNVSTPRAAATSAATRLDQRFNMYSYVEKYLTRFGLDGRACVLRAVCERSEFEIVADGIVSEVISKLLEVSITTASDVTRTDYHEAELYGHEFGHCAEKYNKCPISLFSWFEN